MGYTTKCIFCAYYKKHCPINIGRNYCRWQEHCNVYLTNGASNNAVFLDGTEYLTLLAHLSPFYLENKLDMPAIVYV